VILAMVWFFDMHIFGGESEIPVSNGAMFSCVHYDIHGLMYLGGVTIIFLSDLVLRGSSTM
jgi:hypothetical protein